MIENVATRCHILKPKCTKFGFGWGSAPDPAAGAYSAPDPLLRGPTSKGREEGRTGGKGKSGGVEGSGREGKGGEERDGKRTSERSPSSKFATTPPTILSCSQD